MSSQCKSNFDIELDFELLSDFEFRSNIKLLVCLKVDSEFEIAILIQI